MADINNNKKVLYCFIFTEFNIDKRPLKILLESVIRKKKESTIYGIISSFRRIFIYIYQGWLSESAIWNPESAVFLNKLSGIRIRNFSADSFKNPKPEIRDISAQILNFLLHIWKTIFTQFYFKFLVSITNYKNY